LQRWTSLWNCSTVFWFGHFKYILPWVFIIICWRLLNWRNCRTHINLSSTMWIKVSKKKKLYCCAAALSALEADLSAEWSLKKNDLLLVRAERSSESCCFGIWIVSHKIKFYVPLNELCGLTYLFSPVRRKRVHACCWWGVVLVRMPRESEKARTRCECYNIIDFIIDLQIHASILYKD